jgi:hypothetical protein
VVAKKEYLINIEGESVTTWGNFKESTEWKKTWKVNTLDEVKNILSIFFEEEPEELIDEMKSIFIFKQELL